jgi:Type I site-specific restriction-modification system, R (restriction) subunit and related helicases
VQLRPYQVEAVERIIERHNLLLAMVMGSGKTATSIVAVRQLRREREVTNGAVFCLKSIKWQWVREIAKWDRRARVQVVDGDRAARHWGIRHASEFTTRFCTTSA